MLRHVGIILTFAALLALSVWAAPLGAAPPEADERPFRQRAGQQRLQRWLAHFNRQLDDDVRWLREQGLEAYADRVAELLKDHEREDRPLLWQVHRRVEELKRLEGRNRERAVTEIRLDYEAADLSAKLRDETLDAQQRERLRKELRRTLEKQLRHRIGTQEAIARSIRRRMDKMAQDLSNEEVLRDEIVRQRFQMLADPERPLPDPLLHVAGISEDDLAAASDDGDPLDRRQGDQPRAEAPELSRLFEQKLDEDVLWLRQKDLPRLAERIETLRTGQAPGKRLLLFRLHRRLVQLQGLEGQALEEATKTIRLGFDVLDQARALREATPGERDALQMQLIEGLEQLFAARIDSQRAVLETIEGRLNEIREKSERQKELADEIIERRLKELSDTTRPPYEPELVPQSQMERTRSRGRHERPERPERPQREQGPRDRQHWRGHRPPARD